jgi:hypothetical protein
MMDKLPKDSYSFSSDVERALRVVKLAKKAVERNNLRSEVSSKLYAAGILLESAVESMDGNEDFDVLLDDVRKIAEKLSIIQNQAKEL